MVGLNVLWARNLTTALILSRNRVDAPLSLVSKYVD
jgi:hypothetical protein